jgi:cytochrome c-type biogenesis protein CcmH/NrfG
MGVDDQQFAAARQLLQQRHYQEAMQTYSGLLETAPTVSPLITELEGAVDSHPSQPLLRRLLGDAYMRNGQLQKALETYRKALDQL